MIAIVQALIDKINGIVGTENIMSDLIGSVVQPFTDIVGNWFYVIIWTVLAAGILLKSESSALASVILLLSAVFAAATIDTASVYVYSILIAIGFAVVIYRVYRGRTS